MRAKTRITRRLPTTENVPGGPKEKPDEGLSAFHSHLSVEMQIFSLTSQQGGFRTCFLRGDGNIHKPSKNAHLGKSSPADSVHFSVSNQTYGLKLPW